MPVSYTKFPEQQAGHCDDVNKRHYKLSNSIVLKGCQDTARQPSAAERGQYLLLLSGPQNWKSMI